MAPGVRLSIVYGEDTSLNILGELVEVFENSVSFSLKVE